MSRPERHRSLSHRELSSNESPLDGLTSIENEINLIEPQLNPIAQARDPKHHLASFTTVVRTVQSAADKFRRTRSMYAPSPKCNFGPKAGIAIPEKNCILTIQDPSSQRLTWHEPPSNVLLIKKPDVTLHEPFKNALRWLLSNSLTVFTELKDLETHEVLQDPDFKELIEKIKTFREGIDDLADKIDLIICLGGDGTLLYASSLFQRSCPPVMSFKMGTLGFLTPFEFHNFKESIAEVLKGGVPLILRSRLECFIHRHKSQDGSCDSRASPPVNGNCDIEEKAILALNEVVIDRGQSAFLSNLDLSLNGRIVTSVNGDGLIISTATGSTAYAAAAGASMCHPSVPAVIICPICPHSLSFRPIVIPAGVELKVTLNTDARDNAWVSFDGRMRQQFCRGRSITITTSVYPVPSISRQDALTDWFDSLAECLHWNVHKRHNAFYSGSLNVSSSTSNQDDNDSDAVQAQSAVDQ